MTVSPCYRKDASLLVVVVNLNGFEVFGFEDLPALEAFHVIDAIAAGYDLSSIVFADGLHTERFIGIILAARMSLSSPPFGRAKLVRFERRPQRCPAAGREPTLSSKPRRIPHHLRMLF